MTDRDRSDLRDFRDRIATLAVGALGCLLAGALVTFGGRVGELALLVLFGLFIAVCHTQNRLLRRTTTLLERVADMPTIHGIPVVLSRDGEALVSLKLATLERLTTQMHEPNIEHALDVLLTRDEINAWPDHGQR